MGSQPLIGSLTLYCNNFLIVVIHLINKYYQKLIKFLYLQILINHPISAIYFKCIHSWLSYNFNVLAKKQLSLCFVHLESLHLHWSVVQLTANVINQRNRITKWLNVTLFQEELSLKYKNIVIKFNNLFINYQKGLYSKITSDLVAQVKANFPKNSKQYNQIPFKQSFKFWSNKKDKILQALNKILSVTNQNNLENIRIYQPCKFNSNIIKSSQPLEQFFKKPGLYFNLLYRASQNNFLIQSFHNKCDNKQNTLVLILTQYNKVVGGFTCLPWKSLTNQVYEKDIQKKSFMFSITMNQKFELINPDKAILNFKSYGPVFGQGHDIWIQDRANKKNNSFFYFPCSYNNGKLQMSKQTQYSFTGSPDNKPKMKIKQWEVFQVEWINKS